MSEDIRISMFEVVGSPFCKVEDMEQDYLALLKLVVDNAKLYFKNPKRFDKVVEEIQGNEDESQSDTSGATQLYIER